MVWNWQKNDWPRFTWDAAPLGELELRLLVAAGYLAGATSHLPPADAEHLRITLLSHEALKTSEIEGLILDHDSLQVSLRRQFGLPADGRAVGPAEQGVAALMADLYRTYDQPLRHEALWAWQALLTTGRTDLADLGRYRTHQDAMQIVSGPVHRPVVHFEAPPSHRVPGEMAAYIDWFNQSAPGGASPLPALSRAGVAHLYFVCIHPFEDGNGRLARALAEKALAQSLGRPTLFALAQVISRQRKRYYQALEAANTDNELTDWLVYFAETVLEACRYSRRLVGFLIQKARFYHQYHHQLNDRQAKVLARMFREGPEGFAGGLNAHKYQRITGASAATTTRDLAELTALGALTRTGERKYTRYDLNLPASPLDDI
mgnify:CR=1 FL=1